MVQQDDPEPVDTPTVRAARRIDKVFDKSVEKAKQIYTDISGSGSKFIANGRTTAAAKLDQVQNKLGEDYQQIFADNPLVVNSLSQAPLLLNNRELLSTALNASWMTTLLWTAATGATLAFRRPVGRSLGGLFHYGPGHVQHWDQVNRFMDSVAGSGHRLKFGHSVDFLPEIVERFGMEGVPAFFCHLLQDSTSVDGIPVLPDAWAIKQTLQLAGLSAKISTALVSLSASHVLAGAMLATTIWKIWDKNKRHHRTQKFLQAAETATQHLDYTGAIENYKRALELDRSPCTLTALGQVYLHRKATRPYAHRAFTDAVQLLSTDRERTIPYHGAQVSLRGIAGLQALATADVIGERYPQYWQEQVDDLVNGTIHSFVSTAVKLERDAERRVANPLARPPLFSAAINRYLAARTACQYPFLDNRQALVKTHLTGAIGLVGQVGRQKNTILLQPASQLRDVWVRTLLPSEESDLLLATA